jgi:hypothetical protein
MLLFCTATGRGSRMHLGTIWSDDEGEDDEETGLVYFKMKIKREKATLVPVVRGQRPRRTEEQANKQKHGGGLCPCFLTSYVMIISFKYKYLQALKITCVLLSCCMDILS